MKRFGVTNLLNIWSGEIGELDDVDDDESTLRALFGTDGL
jgi:hypothetical protein